MPSLSIEKPQLNNKIIFIYKKIFAMGTWDREEKEWSDPWS